jgi:hypothetical protein
MRWDVPLRVLGGLHYLALAQGIDPWSDARAALDEHRDWLTLFVAEQTVQTNEVRRCWGLLPAFLSLGAGPLNLLELGPSGGLNLLWDRYRYRYGQEWWGPEEANLELEGEVRGALPEGLLRVHPVVRSRRGVDLNPVDVTTEEGARVLECFVWADQTERLERIRQAMDVVRDDPPELISGDYVELLPQLLEERRDDGLTVVFQTASFIYLTPEERDAVYDALEQAGREAPLAWITYEDDYELQVQVWPGPKRSVARMDFHGAWLEWLDDG